MRCVRPLSRPLPKEEERLLPVDDSDLGVKVELGRVPNELLELLEERPTVVRVLLCREPKLELLRLFCCCLDALPKLPLEVPEDLREPKLTRFP